MSQWGWPCGCPQCLGDEPEEYDPFYEWASDEAERQFDANADRYAGEDVWDFAERTLGPPQDTVAE